MRHALLIPSLLLAACSAPAPSENAAAEGDAPEATTEQAPDTAAAPDMAGATALVEQIYARYGEGGNGQDFSDPSSLFEPELAAAMAADAEQSQASGEVGKLDFDPFCQCQDWAPFTAQLSAPRMDGDTAVVESTFDNFGEGDGRTVELRLVPVDGGWRIADVIDAEGGSLRDLMMGSD